MYTFIKLWNCYNSLPETPERDEQELALQIALMLAWKGYPGIEWENVCNRALELSRQKGEIQQMCLVLNDLAIIYYVRAQYQRARQYIEEAIHVAQQADDPLNESLGYWILGFLLFGMGDYTSARSYLEKAVNYYVPEEHHQLSVHLRGVDGVLKRHGLFSLLLMEPWISRPGSGSQYQDPAFSPRIEPPIYSG